MKEFTIMNIHFFSDENTVNTKEEKIKILDEAVRRYKTICIEGDADQLILFSDYMKEVRKVNAISTPLIIFKVIE